MTDTIIEYLASSVLVPILLTLLGLISSIVTYIISKKIHKNQETFSEQTIDMLNNANKELQQERQRIINEFNSNYHSSNFTKENVDDIKDIIFNLYDKEDTIISKSFFDKNVERLIQSYHEQALYQSRIQFWLSLIASVVGFISVIIILFFSNDLQWYEYIIRTLPGIIIEAVSILFFSQSKEIRERASDFLNRLQEDRHFNRSMEIVDTISDENLKSLIKAEIALHLCGITDIDLITNEIKNK